MNYKKILLLHLPYHRLLKPSSVMNFLHCWWHIVFAWIQCNQLKDHWLSFVWYNNHSVEYYPRRKVLFSMPPTIILNKLHKFVKLKMISHSFINQTITVPPPWASATSCTSRICNTFVCWSQFQLKSCLSKNAIDLHSYRSSIQSEDWSSEFIVHFFQFHRF